MSNILGGNVKMKYRRGAKILFGESGGFTRESAMPHCACVLGGTCLFVTPWTVALRSPLSVGFPRQEYCSGLPLPPPADLPDPGLNLVSCIGSWILYREATGETPTPHSGSPKSSVG